MIYTIGPYLLPDLVRQAIEHVPQMPLMLQENFTAKLLEMLRTGELDCAIMAEPFPDTGLAVAPLYDEPFMVAVPKPHPLAKRKSVSAEELKHETMLLLGTGHCFRDHVLEVCPEYARFAQRRRGHPQELRGLVARDHQVHGRLGHGRDRGAAAQRAQGHAAARASTSRSPSRCRRAAWCWRGAAPSRATRRSRRCATRSTPARWKA